MKIERILFPGHIIEYPYPLFYDKKDKGLFYDENYSFQIPLIKIFELKNAVINQHTVMSDWKVQDQFLRHNRINILNRVKRLIQISIQTQIRRKKVILGYQVWGNNYFHWMTETLPAIITMNQCNAEAMVMLPESLHRVSFVRDALCMLSLKYEFFNDKQAVKTESLFAIPIPHVGRFHHTYMHQTAKVLKNSAGVVEGIVPYRRVYITRSNARRRKVINEVELIEFLRKYDFEIHKLEDYTIKEQIHLFHEAAIVLSNHGAGLTNIMFMNEGSRVLELKSAQNNYWCFFSLANVFGLQYGYQLCSSTNLNHREADIFVDLFNLSFRLTELLQKSVG